MYKDCDIFTPKKYVNILLNKINYKENILNKKVLENSCGDGNIISEIVKRYIKDAINNKQSYEDIKKGLEENIYGAEIDPTHYKNCIKNLDKVALMYGIENVNWNIINKDILKEDLKIKFDFIIGNPPYIKYHKIDEENRVFLKETFKSCSKGNFDYCYAFIEYSIQHLNEKGAMSYLIPNSIFKNISAQELRNIMLPYLKEIKDFIGKKVFENALVSPAIIVLDKKYKENYIKYNNKKIKKDKLNDTKWILSNDSKKYHNVFSEYYNASVTIATQKNNVFVFIPSSEDNQYYYINNHKIEKKITKNTCSPKTINKGLNERLIFPYKYNKNGEVEKYTEKEFKTKFPQTYKYLKSHYNELMSRKKDSSSQWFEYGRSQALKNANKEKLLMSIVITKQVKVYHLDKDTIPYSGIYITAKNNNNIIKAKENLESKLFYDYVQNIGITSGVNSIRITSRDVNNFKF